jgi:hypothetical protein
MPLLFRPWDRKPPQTHRLLHQHPLARALVLAVSFQDASGNDEIQNRAHHGNTALNDWIVDGQCGLALRGTNAETDTGLILSSANGDMAGIDELSVAGVIRQRATTTTDDQIFTKHRSGFGVWQMRKSRNTGSNQLQFGCRNTSGEEPVAGASYPDSQNYVWRLVVGTFNGPLQRVRIYWDGHLQNEAAYTNTTGAQNRNYQIGVFANRTTKDEANFDVAAFFGWHRELTPGEIAHWETDWWQLFVPQTMFVPAPVPTSEVFLPYYPKKENVLLRM